MGNLSKRIESGERFESFAPVLEAICRTHNPGWLLLARWHMEKRTTEGYQRAKEELRRFLENGPPSGDAAMAWQLLGRACYQTGDALGEVHAFVERSQLAEVPFRDLSNTANRVNQLLRHGVEIDKEQKRDLARRILAVIHARSNEGKADDFSRMAWLAISLDQESAARDYVERGLAMEPANYHLGRLAVRLSMGL